MPLPTKMSESPGLDNSDLYESSPPPTRSRGVHAQPSMSPSPVASISSDKENRNSRATTDKSSNRLPMGPPRVPSPGGKRKRTTERERERDNTTSERVRRRRTVEADDEDMYDPDQNIAERRRIRKGLRDLSKALDINKIEYLERGSTGLRDTLRAANELADQVKQTADATIDSKLLTNAADLTLARAVALVSGDSALCVDVDDFVAKCASFMRNAEGAAEDDGVAPTATQRQRRARGEEDDDNGDHLNWAHLGRVACLKHNARPSVPGFLLGPLSLEKRAKKIVVRKAAFKHTDMQETRPEVVKAADVQTDENANLSELCKQILARLRKVKKAAVTAVGDQATDSMTEKEVTRLMDKYAVSIDGGIALFKFVINPFSFGQTIENIFYVSFLIRDGKVGISEDDRGLPYLEVIERDDEGEETGRGSARKHQAVLSLDMESWKHLIELFKIKEPMIRHREEEEAQNTVGAKGWYI